MPAITTEVRSGETQKVGELEITPTSSLIKVQIPGYPRAALVWNRPRAVIVRSPGGEERILPVRDVTRLAIWSMLAGGVLGAIVLGLMYRRK